MRSQKKQAPEADLVHWEEALQLFVNPFSEICFLFLEGKNNIPASTNAAICLPGFTCLVFHPPLNDGPNPV
jgi:hypothetical protein